MRALERRGKRKRGGGKGKIIHTKNTRRGEVKRPAARKNTNARRDADWRLRDLFAHQKLQKQPVRWSGLLVVTAIALAILISRVLVYSRSHVSKVICTVSRNHPLGQGATRPFISSAAVAPPPDESEREGASRRRGRRVAAPPISSPSSAAYPPAARAQHVPGA